MSGRRRRPTAGTTSPLGRVLRIVATCLVVAAALASPGSARMQLVWADEFSVDGRPDPRNWSHELGNVRNKELQWYQAENSFVRDGVLVIEARREQKNGSAYTSASLQSKNLREFRHGTLEVRARMDPRMGLWPAVWALGANVDTVQWPRSGEIDLFEFHQKHVLANIVYGPTTPTWVTAKLPVSRFTATDEDWGNEFHVLRMEWNEHMISLYLDGVLLLSFEVDDATGPDGYNPFHQEFYLLMNLAVGGTSGGDPSRTTFPARFEIDYVRLYQ